MGLYLRQEFVLLFFDELRGGDRRWVIDTAQPWRTVVAKLRELKLTPITVRIKKDQTEVWFIDMGNKRAADMKLFTSDVNGQASATPGVAELLGNPDREMAISEWRQKIHAFEQGSGQHLSVQLSSNIWISAAAAVHIPAAKRCHFLRLAWLFPSTSALAGMSALSWKYPGVKNRIWNL